MCLRLYSLRLARFANEPETYKAFLEILHTYQKEQRGIKEVLDEVRACEDPLQHCNASD